MSFVDMGGYAAYVWSAFGATAVILGVLALTTVRSLRAREQVLNDLQGNQSAGREARAGKGEA